jgi:hypothetical protein
MTDTSAVLSKSPDVVARKIDEENILVPIRQSAGDLRCIYTTSGVASSVWDLIDGKRPIGEIVDAIVREYDVSAEQARADIDGFVADLVDTGCAVWVSPVAEG